MRRRIFILAVVGGFISYLACCAFWLTSPSLEWLSGRVFYSAALAFATTGNLDSSTAYYEQCTDSRSGAIFLLNDVQQSIAGSLARAVAFAPAAFAIATLSLILGFKLYKPKYLRCPACGYILKGLSEPRCPECGRAI